MFIYMLRNKINDKVYIGQDSGSPDDLARVKVHIADARRISKGSKLKFVSKIANAISKYGIEAFEVVILSKGHKDQDSLNGAEIAAIKKFDAITNGYNILPGGQGLPANSTVKDPLLLEQYKAIRSRGAKTANANRWNNASDKDRSKWKSQLINGRLNGDWQKKIQASWDNLSPDERQNRGRQMKEGRPHRFVLLTPEGKELLIETNLRTLLASLNTKTSKKQIERVVRNENRYHCEEFSIEKRSR